MIVSVVLRRRLFMFLHLLYVAMCDKLYIILIFISRKIYYFLSSSSHKSLTIRGTQFLVRKGGGKNFKKNIYWWKFKEWNPLTSFFKSVIMERINGPLFNPPYCLLPPFLKCLAPMEMWRGKCQEKDKSITSLKLLYQYLFLDWLLSVPSYVSMYPTWFLWQLFDLTMATIWRFG